MNEPKTKIYRFEVDLSQDPAKCVEEIYNELRKLPLTILQGLESYVEDSPLTKPIEDSCFNTSNMSDSGD